MLAQLEQQRRALDDERQDIDAVIETVRRRAGLMLPPARAGRAPTKTKRPAAAANGKRPGKLSDAQLAAARQQFEAGVPLVTIAKPLKVTGEAIAGRARAGGWKRPKVEKPPKGEQLAGQVRCNHCGRMTDWDPCRGCGKKLTRSY